MLKICYYIKNINTNYLNMFGNVLKNTWGKNIMIKRNGQRIAAIAMTVALMGQNVSPIFSLESLKGIETVTSENEAKAEELAPQDQYEETEKSELEETEFERIIRN